MNKIYWNTETFNVSIEKLFEGFYRVTMFENAGIAGMRFQIKVTANEISFLDPQTFWRDFFQNIFPKYLPFPPYEIYNLLFDTLETVKWF